MSAPQECPEVTVASAAGALLLEAHEVHGACYPFGTLTRYREAAELFRQALKLADSSGETDRRYEALIFFCDLNGDVQYYLEQRYRRAGVWYGRATRVTERYIATNASDVDFWEGELSYFRGMRAEALALAASGAGDIKTAVGMFSSARRAYRQNLDRVGVTAPMAPHLLHSMLALHADRCVLLATQANIGREIWARKLLDRAQTCYKRALDHNPTWAVSGTCDTYAAAVEDIRRVEKIITARERCK